MNHKKHKHINGVWQEKEVAYLRLQGFDHPDIKWCVLEKVHGSNFAFYMDIDDLKVAKRSSFLKDGDNFYQYLRMRESNGYKIRDVWNQLVAMEYELEEIIVYGELFGGLYPHPEVERLSNVQKVQKGVFYSHDIHFYCFDIMVNGTFLPMDLVEALCEDCDIMYAKILFEGTFDECSKYSNEFQTKIPEWLGLPLFNPNEKHKIVRLVYDGLDKEGEIKYKEKIIEFYGNICEGIVIKPIEQLLYDDGNRVILKSKNEVFKELSSEKTVRKKKEHKELSPAAIETLDFLSYYVNENRLRNVISKIGSFSKKDFKKIFDAFKKDIYEDFNINHDTLRYMDKVDKSTIDKVVGKLCTDIWRPIFLTEAER